MLMYKDAVDLLSHIPNWHLFPESNPDSIVNRERKHWLWVDFALNVRINEE